MTTPKKALTIAGIDCSGGAGVLADIKTFQERDVYGLCANTVQVAMDPKTWGHLIHPLDLEIVREQFRTAMAVGVDAVKTGMLPAAATIREVGRMLKEAGQANVVIDPVMVCKGANVPVFPENTTAMIEALMPIATVTTPNTFEASQLAGMPELTSEDDLAEAARRIHAFGAKNVIIKAARIFQDKAVDMLYDGKDFTWIREPRLETKWTHGAGCTFSACVTAELAKGQSVAQAFQTAHEFLRAALEESFPFNEVTGPVYHHALAKRRHGE